LQRVLCTGAPFVAGSVRGALAAVFFSCHRFWGWRRPEARAPPSLRTTLASLLHGPPMPTSPRSARQQRAHTADPSASEDNGSIFSVGQPRSSGTHYSLAPEPSARLI